MDDINQGLTVTQLRWLNRAAWAALIVGFVYTVWRAPSIIQTQTGDFVAYYGSALALAHGFDVGSLYIDTNFREIITHLGINQRSIFFPNPPSIPALFLPFTLQPFQNAFLIWSLMNCGIAVVVVVLLVRLASLSGAYRLIFIAIALNFQPFRSNISHGQIYIALSALLLLAWWCYRQQHAARFGAVLGVMLITKVFAAHLWLLPLGMLLRRAWRVWMSGLAAIALVVAISAAITGLPAWKTWLSTSLQRTSSELAQRSTTVRSIVSPAYQSVHGTLGHLMTYDEQWNPNPMLRANGLAQPLSATLALAVTALGVWLVRQRAAIQGAHADAVFASLASMSIVLFPYALDYMYAAAIVPLGLWVRWLQTGQSPKVHIGVLAGVVLVGAGYAAKSPALANGVLGVLAHLKVYGMLLLIGVTAWQVHRTQHQPQATLARAVQPQ
ncbi:MAG: DUF2029 domain-containing protein [Anaerolineae bacterium]|nr:DUF2029 domain-containing protein [Anaerolineae bacterium]